MTAEKCKCCEDDLGQVFYLDVTLGPVCDDCEEGIRNGRELLAAEGVTGIITANKTR